MKETKKIDSWIYAIPFLILLTIACYVIIQFRIKTLGMILFELGPFLISTFSLVVFIIGLIYSIKRPPFFSKWRLIGFLSLILLFFNSLVYGKFPSYYDDKPSLVQFRVPTDSELTVAWGGKTIKENYHAIATDQCWAYDLVITKNGKTFSGNGDKLTDYFCYGEKLKAPAGGKIVKAYHDDPEMPIGLLGGGSTPFGNHIIIEVAPSEFLFLCHLQPKSIKVNEGDLVKKGQELGLLGNSGNTSEPHLHIHLQNDPDFGEGIPMYFYDLILNDTFVKKAIPAGGVDRNGTIIGQKIRNNINTGTNTVND